MGFGGPVWHASVMPAAGKYVSLAQIRAAAEAALAGVGDASRGQWEEVHRALHLRRRLSVAEEALVGPAVDVRDSPEALSRFERVRPYLPAGWRGSIA